MVIDLNGVAGARERRGHFVGLRAGMSWREDIGATVVEKWLLLWCPFLFFWAKEKDKHRNNRWATQTAQGK